MMGFVVLTHFYFFMYAKHLTDIFILLRSVSTAVSKYTL